MPSHVFVPPVRLFIPLPFSSHQPHQRSCSCAPTTMFICPSCSPCSCSCLSASFCLIEIDRDPETRRHRARRASPPFSSRFTRLLTRSPSSLPITDFSFVTCHHHTVAHCANATPASPPASQCQPPPRHARHAQTMSSPPSHPGVARSSGRFHAAFPPAHSPHSSPRHAHHAVFSPPAQLQKRRPPQFSGYAALASGTMPLPPAYFHGNNSQR